MKSRMQKGRRGNGNSILPFVCFILIWLFVIGAIFLVSFIKNRTPEDTSPNTITDTAASVPDTAGDVPGDDKTEPITDAGTDDPEPVTYSEATVVSAGDIIFHMAQINYAKAAGADGYYDFSNSFKYIKDIISGADYAVANYETTLAGSDYEYSGYPSFKAPDSSLDAIKSAGFDLMLFANNHCYDSNLDGLIRTQKKFTESGLSYIGAKQEPDAAAYSIVEINGIRIGMINYADDLSGGITEKRTVNGKAIKNNDLDYMNLYNLSLTDEFYDEVGGIIDKMESEDVDFTVAYIHWGNEYRIEHNVHQEKVASALCDLGIDVIIGGHPHVVEDVKLLTSKTDSSHKTLCFYSLGNLVSNQNRRTMGDTNNSIYTEGGLIVSLTLRKYSTGEVMISGVEQIPTFVHRYKTSNGYYAHEIVPLPLATANPEAYGLTASNFGADDAAEVYALQNAVFGDTVEAFNASIVLPAITENE